MNLLLIMREELVCLGILVYLLIYSLKFVREDVFFLRLNLFAIGHVLFDLITVYTVNHLKQVPMLVNQVCHAVFYIFAILFCCELFRYVLSITQKNKKSKAPGKWVYFVPIVYLLCIPFLEIDYLQGNGSNYSFGQCVFMGYALAMLFFFAGEILLLLHIKELSANVKKALVPSFVLMSIAVILQIFIPELLFTGADVTLVTVGVYFALVNPLEKYKERAYMDSTFNIKNRNAYKEDVDKLLSSLEVKSNENSLTLVVFDMNGLKQINDNYGHVTGDIYLKALTDILKAKLVSAWNIYRMGGDEFTAIYLGVDYQKVCAEIDTVIQTCAQTDTGYELPLSVSYGIAQRNHDEDYDTLIHRADQYMFDCKRKIYQDTKMDRRKR